MQTLSASEIFRSLYTQTKLIGKSGYISFNLNDLEVRIQAKDSIGNLLQEWFEAWLSSKEVWFEKAANSQQFPDFFLSPQNPKQGLLEVKTFDWTRGPGFDLANFDAYCNSLLTDAYRLDCDYLIFAYTMDNGQIKIQDMWLKKIWEMACPSSTYPLKVQEKKNIIYNIRPSIWYSERAKFKPFRSKEEFLNALNETRYQYPQTRHGNAHWLNKVLKNYELHTGVRLTV